MVVFQIINPGHLYTFIVFIYFENIVINKMKLFWSTTAVKANVAIAATVVVVAIAAEAIVIKFLVRA